MTRLSEEERLLAVQFNARARQIFWNAAVPVACPVWRLGDYEIVDWVVEYQERQGLRVDGRLGPSTMIVMMAESRGGLGDMIIDGKEVEGFRVARMFVPNPTTAAVQPDVCCVLSQSELDRETRDRVNGTGGRIRSHFSIDSSMGRNSESLIIQWADPMRSVGFCPVSESMDYPRQRQCVGIELENVLLLYQLDSDERRWLRRRPVIKAQIGNGFVSQPILYEEQVRALKRLMETLEVHCQIPMVFPKDEAGAYFTGLLDGSVLSEFSGYLAKFHYFSQNNEPGVGFALMLERLFGAIERSEMISERKVIVMEADKYLSEQEEARQLLAQSVQATQAFVPTHEADPRFNLSAAITQAYGTGKVARAARIAQRCQTVDKDGE